MKYSDVEQGSIFLGYHKQIWKVLTIEDNQVRFLDIKKNKIHICQLRRFYRWLREDITETYGVTNEA